MHIRMHHLDSFDWTVILSIGALAMSNVAIFLVDRTAMELISAVSAILLCLTAFVKFVDLLYDKFQKWGVAKIPAKLIKLWQSLRNKK